MDPHSGKLYNQDEMLKLSEEERSRLVQLHGRREDIERISAAVAGLNRAERRAAERAEKRAKR
jgi:hypothetical protein